MNDKYVMNLVRDFEQEVLGAELPVAVYFYSEDCAPCTAFEPVFRRFAEQLEGKMKFVRIFRQQNRELADKLHIKTSPTVLFYRDGAEVCSRLAGYVSAAELRSSAENILGGSCHNPKKEKVFCDVLILGGGPAGLSAAIYAGRAKLYAIVVEEGIPGGQVSSTYHVANYPGTNGVIRGIDLMDNMKKQAVDFGARIDDLQHIEEVRLGPEEKVVRTADIEYFPKSVIVATGSQPRKLPAEGEKEFRGLGVHYCATCDGAFYQDMDVVVVGGGSSAVEEAVFLTRFAKHVTILNRKDYFNAAKVEQDEVLNHPNISVIWNTEVRKVLGESFVTGLLMEDLKTHETRELKTDGIFVYIGMEPGTGLFRQYLKLEADGYIPTDENMATDIPGVYAAGDVRKKNIRQIATATADGVIAGISVERYLNGR